MSEGDPIRRLDPIGPFAACGDLTVLLRWLTAAVTADSAEAALR